MSNAKNALEKLIQYVPDDVPNKEHFIKTVNEQVLGTDKQGQNRPIADLVYFMSVCNQTGLNPITKQIYAIYRWDKYSKKDKMTIQAGIDGLRSIAERTGKYGGSSDAVFDYDDDGNPIKATITIYKVMGDKIIESKASAKMSEYMPNSDMYRGLWAKMPETMLAKCAEAKGLRKAFPVTEQIYAPEEMHQADEPEIVVKPVEKKQIKKESDNIMNELIKDNEND